MASALAWHHVQAVQSFQHVAQRVAHASQRKKLVLPSSARLTTPHDFARTTKSGLRVTTQNFVGYLYISPASTDSPRAGLIIGKSVGGSVRRHRVSRQIRHALALELSNFPTGSLIVIRGLKQGEGVDVQREIREISTRLISKFNSRVVAAQ
jgi:ribonuclease P protein component